MDIKQSKYRNTSLNKHRDVCHSMRTLLASRHELMKGYN